MSAESPRHARSGGPLTVPSQPPSERSVIDAVSGFINDVTLSSSSAGDPKDVIQWARFETADINEPTPEGDSDTDISPLLLILGYGSGVQVWLIPPTGEAQEVLSWRQGTVRVLRILPTPQHGDGYASKRPLIALCDSASPGPAFCSLSFISIRGGEQVKSIKFKNQILDVLANKRSVVVSFSERFAVFDAATLEDRMAITTCYPCPCPLGGSSTINPLALGERWLAYADKKLNQSKRSSGGCEGEGVTSYTATVLHAAKSLSKGLRGLGESVAHSLAGGRSTSQSPSPPNADMQQPGVITILDIENNEEEDGQDNEEPYDPIVAHFIAHSEAIIAMKFDASGMLLVTADRRGHDFHVFRINPHPCGPSLASVHHLYILHRGDTTAKVQDIAISWDSRFAAISTLRGTTHVFAVSPYGGPCGVRTHTAPRVVNRLSRFHRSAGLPIHATTAAAHVSGSPVSDGISHGSWFPNPRLPPYPLPTTVAPLAQLRPTNNLPTHTITRTSAGRQRLSSLSEDCNTAPLLARARFGLAPCPQQSRAAPSVALYLVAASGCLSHIALHPRPARSVPKEKICDESPIELEVEPIAQWPLQRPSAAADLLAPLPPSNPLLQPLSCRRCADMCMSEEERWLSQVEIVTHAGPHRRLWMGPQFVFKTYNCTGSNSSLSEVETVEVVASGGIARSNPVNMPGARPLVPVLVDSGSASSLEHSPSDSFRRKSLLAESGRAASVCDVQLKEDLAEAMKEDHGWREESPSPRRERRTPAAVERVVDPLGTVVAPPPAAEPPPADDPDSYTSSNADEGTFRPVVRAPATLTLHPDIVVRPLPRNTTIPVQNVSPIGSLSPADEPIPLKTDVVIPAALTSVQGCHASNRAGQETVGNVTTKEVAVSDKIEQKSTQMESVSEFAAHSDKLIDKANKIEKQSEIRVDGYKTDKSAAEVETQTKSDKSARKKDALKADKPPAQKEPSPKLEKNKKDIASKTEKSLGQKCAIANIEKPVTQKDAVKVDKNAVQNESTADITVKKDSVEKYDKQTKQKFDDETVKTFEPDKRVTDIVNRISVDVKNKDVNKDLKRQENDESKRDRQSDRGLEPAERVSVDSKSLPKSNRPPDDIQPVASVRVKKSPTPKSVSDKDSEDSVKDKPTQETKAKQEQEPNKEIKKQKDLKEFKSKEKESEIQVIEDMKGKDSKNATKYDIKHLDEKEAAKDEPLIAVTLIVSSNQKLPDFESEKRVDDDIKTEEQAWDMLLNEPQKPATLEINQTGDRIEDKPKSKKGRKLRKAQDDAQEKAEEDSFIEIHAIEDKQQACSGELVSISTPFEDVDPVNSFLKSKKSKSKSFTPEINDFERKSSFEIVSHEEREAYCSKSKSPKKLVNVSEFELTPQIKPKPKDIVRETSNMLRIKKYADVTVSENASIVKESPKPNKSKSLSPYSETRRSSNILEKDVYVINTTEEDFPEIQITRGSKTRRSPQPLERKSLEKEPVIEKPAKSWSSIAASKTVKKVDDVKIDVVEKKAERKDLVDDNPTSSTNVSLQEKLIELCKRTDIMVAECDVPSELNFVEEHHSVIHDLPPLEPLDFGLDDFKLEVMRDSLLEVSDTKLTSPICKINIDDILSSIKETTTKVIESSSFNLIELEKVPARQEKGFSVVEEHKITSQEVKLDDDTIEKEGEAMEKSSDDDNTSPVVSTDSDKDDKKTGASNLILPSSKQSAKSKKSRRKKK